MVKKSGDAQGGDAQGEEMEFGDEQKDTRKSSIRTFHQDGMYPNTNKSIEIDIEGFESKYIAEVGSECITFQFKEKVYIYKCNTENPEDNKIRKLDGIKNYPCKDPLSFAVAKDTVFFVTKNGTGATLNQATIDEVKTHDLGAKPSVMQAFKLASGKIASVSLIPGAIFCTVDKAGKKTATQGQENIAVSYSRAQNKLFVLTVADGDLTVRSYQINQNDAALTNPVNVATATSKPVPSNVQRDKLQPANFAVLIGKDSQPSFLVAFGDNKICKLGDLYAELLVDPAVFRIVTLTQDEDERSARCLVRNTKQSLGATKNRLHVSVVNVLLK